MKTIYTLFFFVLFTMSCGKDMMPERVVACNSGSSSENCDCFKATNKERLNNNLEPMAFCEACARMSQEHADDMAANNFFSHDRPAVGGKPAETFVQRASRFGAGISGENIASGATGNSAVVLWMGSPGHKANILHSSYKSFACGTKNGYSVQVFSVSAQ